MGLNIVHGEWLHLEIAARMGCPQRNHGNETMTYIFFCIFSMYLIVSLQRSYWSLDW